MTDPPRALASWMLPIIFSNTWSCGAIVDDRHLLVDERDRAVLHLAGRIALGVDVGDLLQLQRPFERDRIVDAAPEVEKVAPLIEPPRDLLGQRLALQRLLEQQRQLRQRVEMRVRLRRAAACRESARDTSPAGAARPAAT